MEMSLAFPVDSLLWFFRELNTLEAKTNHRSTTPLTTGLLQHSCGVRVQRTSGPRLNLQHKKGKGSVYTLLIKYQHIPKLCRTFALNSTFQYKLCNS